jgi:hypothetical protein
LCFANLVFEFNSEVDLLKFINNPKVNFLAPIVMEILFFFSLKKKIDEKREKRLQIIPEPFAPETYSVYIKKRINSKAYPLYL